MTNYDRTVKQKAKQFAKLLHKESPDYTYIMELFYNLRKELGISMIKTNKRLP